jgi:hypothetical protein
MPTPEQYNVAFERERQGILDAIERAKEANEAALASLGRGKKRITKLRRKGMSKGKRGGTRRRRGGMRSRKY